MKIKKSLLLCLFAIILVIGTACSSGGNSSSGESASSKASSAEKSEGSASQAETKAEASNSETSNSETKTNGKSDILVVYFSATGTTKGVALEIAELTGADTYEITASRPYSEADLNWNDSNSRSTKEQNDKSARPEIASEKISLDNYKTIFIGYPIWWGEEPRIMDTFVESCDFSGKTMIPFCTSGGSGIGSSGKNLEANAKSGSWQEGKRLTSSDVQGWVKELNI